MKTKQRLQIELNDKQDVFKEMEKAKKLVGVLDVSVVNFNTMVLHYDNRKANEQSILNTIKK